MPFSILNHLSNGSTSTSTMSVNLELQFMAMLEGHDFEQELLGVVSILFFLVGSF